MHSQRKRNWLSPWLRNHCNELGKKEAVHVLQGTLSTAPTRCTPEHCPGDHLCTLTTTVPPFRDSPPPQDPTSWRKIVRNQLIYAPYLLVLGRHGVTTESTVTGGHTETVQPLESTYATWSSTCQPHQLTPCGKLCRRLTITMRQPPPRQIHQHKQSSNTKPRAHPSRSRDRAQTSHFPGGGQHLGHLRDHHLEPGPLSARMANRA